MSTKILVNCGKPGVFSKLAIVDKAVQADKYIPPVKVNFSVFINL